MTLSDMLIIAGMIAIVTATFLLNIIAGVFAAGIALLAAGIWIARGSNR